MADQTWPNFVNSRTSAGALGGTDGLAVVRAGVTYKSDMSAIATFIAGAMSALAVAVGSIEVGHASDTTISRVSAGRIAVEGSNVIMASDLAAGVATFLATPSSANLKAAVTDETGSGSLVFATSPTLVTPVLGAATATSVNGLTITSTTGTLTITNLKTLSVSNTLTLTATDGSTLAIGGGGTLGTAAYKNTGTSGNNVPLLDGANTWSGAQTFNASAIIGDGTTSKSLTIKGANTGTASGSLVVGNNGGSTVWAMGNYSSIFGGTYDPDLIFYNGINDGKYYIAVSGVKKEIVNVDNAVTLNNKTIASPTLSGTVAGSPTASGSWTFSSTATFSTQVIHRFNGTQIFDRTGGGTISIELQTGGTTRGYIGSDSSNSFIGYTSGGSTWLTVDNTTRAVTFPVGYSAAGATITGVALFSGGAGSAITMGDGNYIRFGQAGATGDYYLGKPNSTQLNLQDNASTILAISGGGFVFGSPTGGNKGAGTINATAVYDDNTLLTCYPIEAYLDGRVDLGLWDTRAPRGVHEGARRFTARLGTEFDPLDIDKYAEHWKQKRHLTAFPNKERYDFKNGTLSAGEWVQRLVETVETQAVHIEKLNQRLKLLEAA